MKKIIILVTVLLVSVLGEAQDLNTFFNKSDAFFKANVSNGKVAYKTIKKDRTTLDELLQLAKGISVTKSDANNYQAFWINAYNLSVIKNIIDKYPTNSPLDHEGFFDATTNELGGKTITLNDIEHKLLRAEFNDARFHFVLVCGAIGCPPLLNRAYLPSTLDAQLEKQTVSALNSDYYIRVNTKRKKVSACKIFGWYKEDFTREGISVIDFINKYRKEKIPEGYNLNYYEYDWKLNKQ